MLFVVVLIMTALIVNAQTKAPAAQAKPSTNVVKIADLPKAITDNVAKDYAGFTIKDAKCTNKNNEITYHIVIVKGSTTETLVYDKDGKFVKKLEKTHKKK